mmetsp:Transcript_11976/g.25315  ORF Transcript_11976/g.25315 Transcript_11976/m.25315 type:complete len:272 (+) Transcript_11976:1427-2242(+)
MAACCRDVRVLVDTSRSMTTSTTPWLISRPVSVVPEKGSIWSFPYEQASNCDLRQLSSSKKSFWSWSMLAVGATPLRSMMRITRVWRVPVLAARTRFRGTLGMSSPANWLCSFTRASVGMYILWSSVSTMALLMDTMDSPDTASLEMTVSDRSISTYCKPSSEDSFRGSSQTHSSLDDPLLYSTSSRYNRHEIFSSNRRRGRLWLRLGLGWVCCCCCCWSWSRNRSSSGIGVDIERRERDPWRILVGDTATKIVASTSVTETMLFIVDVDD